MKKCTIQMQIITHPMYIHIFYCSNFSNSLIFWVDVRCQMVKLVFLNDFFIFVKNMKRANFIHSFDSLNVYL